MNVPLWTLSLSRGSCPAWNHFPGKEHFSRISPTPFTSVLLPSPVRIAIRWWLCRRWDPPFTTGIVLSPSFKNSILVSDFLDNLGQAPALLSAPISTWFHVIQWAVRGFTEAKWMTGETSNFGKDPYWRKWWPVVSVWCGWSPGHRLQSRKGQFN